MPYFGKGAQLLIAKNHGVVFNIDKKWLKNVVVTIKISVLKCLDNNKGNITTTSNECKCRSKEHTLLECRTRKDKRLHPRQQYKIQINEAYKTIQNKTSSSRTSHCRLC